MTRGHYAVVRYIADPGRNEPLNIGIVLWDGADYRIGVDEQAVQRVIRDHPRLERDALLYVEPHLNQNLQAVSPTGDEGMRAFLQDQKGFPISFSEPRYTSLPEGDPNALDHNLDRLIQRIVRPQRRGGGTTFDPAQVFERRLRPLIQRRLVERNHFFESSRSGLPRSVDFYANHGSNVAFDTLRLAVIKADEVIHRADAEAGKIYDIKAENPDVKFLVYCDVAHDTDASLTNEKARKVIESTGATFLTNIDDAAKRIEVAVGSTS